MSACRRLAADTAVGDVGVALAAHLGPDDEGEEEEGGDLDATRGTGGAAADEHQDVVDRQRLRGDVGVVDAVEPGRAGHHSAGDATDDLPPPRASPPRVPALAHSSSRNAPMPTTSRSSEP